LSTTFETLFALVIHTTPCLSLSTDFPVKIIYEPYQLSRSMAEMPIPAFKMFELQGSIHVQSKTLDGHKLEHGNSIFDEEAPHYSEHVTCTNRLNGAYVSSA
jgi:hypothetical protein